MTNEMILKETSCLADWVCFALQIASNLIFIANEADMHQARASLESQLMMISIANAFAFYPLQ